MEFCHITPTPHLYKFVQGRSFHLLLAHLVERDENYRAFYKHEKGSKILDNSAFEMFQEKKPMYESSKLIEMGEATRANYIVMSDYPNEPGYKTIKAAQELAPQFKAAEFGTFFVPQSKAGDIEDYIATFAWAASSPLVDYIGMSIIGVPNAFNDLQTPVQRYTARHRMMFELENRGLLDLAYSNGKKIHFLGMTDGPNEIELCQKWYIDTWDSSAAIWNGLHGVPFDTSPTGLQYGKMKKHVDFAFETDDAEKIQLAKNNVAYIDNLVSKYNGLHCKG